MNARRRLPVILVVLVVIASVVLGVSTLAHASGSKQTTRAKPAAVVRARLSGVHEVTYMPSDAAWSAMWTNWNPTRISSDFAKAKTDDVNTVRIIIPATTFTFPKPLPRMTAELSTIVRIAKAHGLKVQLTLFDQFGLYGHLAGSVQWANAILAPYKNDPEISFVELQNEINPSDAQAMTWARYMIPVLRNDLGNVPITVSTPGSEGVAGLAKLKRQLAATPPDFYDYHFYGAMALAYTTLARAKAVASPSPLFIGEAGFATGTTTTSTTLDSEQYLYFELVDKAAHTLNLPAPGVWTMNDLDVRDLQPGQAYFGLFTTTGKAKPALAVVKQYFATGTTAVIANPSFELGGVGVPAGWTSANGANGRLSVSATVARAGTRSVEISDAHGANNLQPAWSTTANLGKVTTGEQVTATVWARGAAATGTSVIAVAWFGTSGNYIRNASSNALPTGTTGWAPLRVQAAAPAGAAYALISLQSTDNTGSVYFDTVGLTT